MATIFFPFADKPKQFEFLHGRVIRMPFIINDLLYYCDVSPSGITMYLHPNALSIENIAMKIMLIDINGTLCLVNGEIGDNGIPVTTLSKKSFIEFKHYGRRLNTIGMLDPIMLGDIDPFSFANITGNSADWMAIESCMLKAISKLIVDFEHIGMQMRSDSRVRTAKAVQLSGLNAISYSTGIGSQRFATIGEMDQYILNVLDDRLITFRVFGNLSAQISVIADE